MQSELAWSKDFETGNLMVDREHKELLALISLISELDRREDSNARDKALELELEALHRHINQHFKNEELLLEAVESSFYVKQCLSHNIIRFELEQLWMPGQKIPSRETIHKIALWAKGCCLEHFLTQDFEAFHSPPFTNDDD